MPKKAEIYTVRNAQGQFLATYRATSPQEAMRRLVNDQATTAGVFRKSQPAADLRNLSASVETLKE